MSNDTAGFSQWGGRAKNVVILLLTGFSREFYSSLRHMAAHPKGSDTPSSSAPCLPFNADATTRSAFSEKYLICLLFLHPPPEGFLLFKMFSAGAINPTPFHFSTDDSPWIRGAAGVCWSQSRLCCGAKAGLHPGSQGHVKRQMTVIYSDDQI